MLAFGTIKNRLLKLSAAFLVAVMLLCGFSYAPDLNADTIAVVVNVTSYLNVRSAPVNGSVVGTLLPGARVTILDTSNPGWYKIQYGSIVGYCSSDYLFIESNESPLPSDVDFETSIASFPESYKGKLRSLHEAHPNWIFTPVDCGTWSSALTLEQKSGVSLVPLTSDRSWLDLSERGVIDSPNWVNASDAIIAYYMDPRNMLSEGNIFQFMDLYYPVAGTTISETAISGALNGTFMAGTTRDFTIDGTNRLAPYQAFAIAAEESGVNPIFLLTHVIQECGANGSSSSSGASGYYNLYNIGAYSNVINASRVGLNFARYGLDDAFNQRYNIPWNTAGKSCVFGAKWIADYYIYRGQSTLYFMRFNLVSGGYYTRGQHQYMTALQSCSSESSRMYQAYKRAGILDTVINFKIPVYSGMPDSASPYPQAMNVTGYPTPTPTATPTEEVTPTPVVEKVQSFVSRLYWLALAREPDMEGFNYWVSAVCFNGGSGQDISLGFIFSPELEAQNLTNEQFVERLYLIYLDRPPEEGGVEYWASCLNNGESKQDVVYGFIHSPEFVSLCEDAGFRAY